MVEEDIKYALMDVWYKIYVDDYQASELKNMVGNLVFVTPRD